MSSFIQLEQSTHMGAPVELYHFYSEAFSTPYFYTSADEDITYNSNVYTSLKRLQRTQSELSRETAAQTLSITVPRDNELAKRWLTYVPPRTVWVTIYRYHRSELTAPEVVVFWQGKVRGVSWSNNETTLECLPIDTAFSRNGLRVTYGGTCRRQLYASGCNVPIVNFMKTATITGILENKIQSPDFVTVVGGVTPAPDGWWVNGFVENTTTKEIRYITGHTGTEITLLLAFETLQPGDVINVAAGCNHKSTTCQNKFNNIVNYGGLGIYMPDTNPFTIKLNE